MNPIFVTSCLRSFAVRVCILLAIVLGATGRVLAESSPACDLNGVERIVAIGDVHGAFDRLTGILTSAGLIDAKGSWAGGKTHLVQLGDVVDRGPDSRKALDLLHRLDGEAARAGGAVHMLLGNHEVARILGDLRFATPGEYAAFASSDSEELRERYLKTTKVADRDEFLKKTPLGLLEMRAAFGRRGNYEWVRRLNTVVRINGVLFVHGGISPAVANFSCEQINNTVRKELSDDLEKTRETPLASLVAREDGPLWYRGLAQLSDGDETAFNDLLGRLQAKAIVIAHTVTIDGRTHVRFNGRLFQIDTGMQPAYVQGGRASALEIVGDTFTAIYEDRRDALNAPGDHRQ
jgi:hypothetical protein